MIALLFIIFITAISLLLNIYLASDVKWIDYYRGAVIGLLVSGIILRTWNNWRRKKEEQKKK